MKIFIAALSQFPAVFGICEMMKEEVPSPAEWMNLTQGGLNYHGKLRLAGQSDEVYGRGALQIFNEHEQEWGTLSKIGFDYSEAMVACNGLGFNCVMEWGTVQQWEDNLNFDDRFMVQQKELPTGYFGLDCHGDEPTLSYCCPGERRWGSKLGHKFDHNDDIVLHCGFSKDIGFGPETVCPHRTNTVVAPKPCKEGRARLTGGDDSYNWGRLEISHAGQFGSVSANEFNKLAADIACRSMGFTQGAKLYKAMKDVLQEMALTEKDSKYMPIWLWSLKCRGYERYLRQCAFGGQTSQLRPTDRLSWGKYARFPFSKYWGHTPAKLYDHENDVVLWCSGDPDMTTVDEDCVGTDNYKKMFAKFSPTTTTTTTTTKKPTTTTTTTTTTTSTTTTTTTTTTPTTTTTTSTTTTSTTKPASTTTSALSNGIFHLSYIISDKKLGRTEIEFTEDVASAIKKTLGPEVEKEILSISARELGENSGKWEVSAIVKAEELSLKDWMRKFWETIILIFLLSFYKIKSSHH